MYVCMLVVLVRICIHGSDLENIKRKTLVNFELLCSCYGRKQTNCANERFIKSKSPGWSVY